MRPEIYELDVKALNGNGTGRNVRDLDEKWVQVTGVFDATIDLEVSLDGTNYARITTAGAITGSVVAGAGALVAVPMVCVKLRVVTSAYVSGTPAAVVSGFDRRTV